MEGSWERRVEDDGIELVDDEWMDCLMNGRMNDATGTFDWLDKTSFERKTRFC